MCISYGEFNNFVRNLEVSAQIIDDPKSDLEPHKKRYGSATLLNQPLLINCSWKFFTNNYWNSELESAQILHLL
jgi:hypothetical protein